MGMYDLGYDLGEGVPMHLWGRVQWLCVLLFVAFGVGMLVLSVVDSVRLP